MKNILATGATGLVGSRFVELYSGQYEVANMDLTTGVDITDKASIERYVDAHPADTMLHLAAFTDTTRAATESGDKSGLCYRVNVEGTKNIVEVCQENSIHLVHVSTDFVFDGKKDTPYTEDDPTNPIDWYGTTKALAEEVVSKSRISHTIARISYPYRKDYDLKPDLVQKVKSGLEEGNLAPQFSDSIITPTFVDDIARAFAKCVEVKPQGIYHFVGSTSLSPYEFARQVASAYGYDPSLVKEGNLTDYLKIATRSFARNVAVSNAKATEQLGLNFMTLEEGLAVIS